VANHPHHKFPSSLTEDERKVIHKLAKNQGLFTKTVGGRYKCLYIYKQDYNLNKTRRQELSNNIQQFTTQTDPIFPNVRQVVDAENASTQPPSGTRKRGRPPKSATQPTLPEQIVQPSQYDLRKRVKKI
jgi:hypothetical protein